MLSLTQSINAIGGLEEQCNRSKFCYSTTIYVESLVFYCVILLLVCTVFGSLFFYCVIRLLVWRVFGSTDYKA